MGSLATAAYSSALFFFRSSRATLLFDDSGVCVVGVGQQRRGFFSLVTTTILFI